MTTKAINVYDYSKEIIETLSKGAFLTTSANGKTNTMTIGWGSIGFKWDHPTFTVMVRQSRYTKELIDSNREFTVSFPLNDGFKQAIGICGSKSGRDVDKFAAANIATLASQSVQPPVIKGCGLHLECKIVEEYTMLPEKFNQELTTKWYPNGDWHTCYTGIITSAYIEE